MTQITTDALVPVAAPARTTSKRSRRLPVRSFVSRLVPPLLLFGLVIAGWYYVSYRVLAPRRRFLLPPPHAVIDKGFLEPRAREELLDGLWATAQVAFLGFAIAAVLGVVGAILMNQAEWIERTLYPYAVFLQTVPILAIVPLIGFWWGFDFRSRVMVCVIISLFPIVTNSLFGLQSVDDNSHDMFTLGRASRWQRLVRLELPTALPAIFTGLRIAAGASVIGSIVGDFFFRQGVPGIGRLIDTYTNNLQSERLLMAVFLSALLGIGVFTLVGVVQERVTGAWAPSRKRRGKRAR